MEYRIACPRRGGEIRHQVKPRWRDPAFLAELERGIRLAAFELLLYHLEDAHPEGPEDLKRNADAPQLQPTRRALLPRREKHVWLRPSGDGPVTVGIDDVAQSLAGPIVSCPPKKAGRAVPKGQSVATIEASKWVGPGAGPGDGRDRRGQRGRETGSGAAER
jgi:hypothetical protein